MQVTYWWKLDQVWNLVISRQKRGHINENFVNTLAVTIMAQILMKLAQRMCLFKTRVKFSSWSSWVKNQVTWANQWKNIDSTLADIFNAQISFCRLFMKFVIYSTIDLGLFNVLLWENCGPSCPLVFCKPFSTAVPKTTDIIIILPMAFFDKNRDCFWTLNFFNIVWLYEGCYVDSSARILEKRLSDSDTNTPQECTTRCGSSGYIYAGLQVI